MSTVTHPRGPLPSRVYWTRRLLVVVVALAIVFGAARLVGAASGGGNDPQARTVGDTPSPTPSTSSTPVATPTTTPTPAATGTVGSPKKSGQKTAKTRAATPLAAPTGVCSDDDVRVTPTVKRHAYAGKPVVFALQVQTSTSAACTWTVSPRHLVLKVTSGSDRIWSTQQCGRAVPKQDVVVRSAQPTTVDLAWSGQRSDDDCSRTTSWAEPGTYHAVAAAFGGSATDLRFALQTPPRPTVTAKPKPKRHHAKHSTRPTASASASPTASATSRATKKPRH